MQGVLDLQTAFPNAYTNSAEFQDLTNWAGMVVTQQPRYCTLPSPRNFCDGAYQFLNLYGYWHDLMWIYNGRSDLQTAFPNAYTSPSSFQSLVNWADAVVSNIPSYGQDTAHADLGYYAPCYIANGTHYSEANMGR